MSQFKEALKTVEGQSPFDKVKDKVELFRDPTPEQEVKKGITAAQVQHAKASAAKEVPALIAYTDTQIVETDTPKLDFVVPGIAPIGCVLCAGKPKSGKSWIWQQIAYAVATGGKALGAFPCGEPGDVLMLDLEGNKGRFKERRQKILGDEAKTDRLTVAFRENARRLDNGLLEQIRKWHASVSRPRMVTIDTLAAVKPVIGHRDRRNVYQYEYDTLNALTSLAHELRILIVVIHHVNKVTWDDPFDSISGTNGLVGACDTPMLFGRSQNGSGFELLGRPRDFEEFEYGLVREGDRFIIVGSAVEVRLSGTRREIIDALRADGSVMTPAAIASATGLKVDTVRKTLAKMLKDGVDGLENPSYGKYRLADAPSGAEEPAADDVFAEAGE